jgi:hypothetical protein
MVVQRFSIMSVRWGQELDRRKGKAGRASGRRLVRHNDEPTWKLTKNNAANTKHCESNRRDLYKVCQIDTEFTQNGANNSR